MIKKTATTLTGVFDLDIDFDEPLCIDYKIRLGSSTWPYEPTQNDVTIDYYVTDESGNTMLKVNHLLPREAIEHMDDQIINDLIYTGTIKELKE